MRWYHDSHGRSQRSDWDDDPELLAEIGVSLIKGEPDDLGVDEPTEPDLDVFGVLIDNWDAVCLYLACQTQWVRRLIIPPMGGEILTDWRGLNYPAVDVVINRTPQFKNSPDPELFFKLQIMEAEALGVFNKAN